MPNCSRHAGAFPALLPIGAGICALVAGAGGFLAGAFESADLTASGTTPVMMSGLNALGVALGGVALLLATRSSRRGVSATRWCVEGAILLIGVAGLVPPPFGLADDPGWWTSGAMPGIDPAARGAGPSVGGAAGLILLAAALMADHLRDRLDLTISRIMATILVMASVIVVLAQSIGMPPLYLAASQSMPPTVANTTLMAVLAVGVLGLHPWQGLRGWMPEPSLAGTLLRVFLPALLILALAIGAFAAMGMGETYGPRFAILMISVGTAAATGAVVVMAAWVLTRSEARLQLRSRALAATPDGVMLCDRSQATRPVVYVNDSFAAITGHGLEDCLGRSCGTVISRLGLEADACDRIQAAIDRGGTLTMTANALRRNGNRYWARLSVSPIRGQGNSMTHMIILLDDVTDEAEREQRLADAIHSATAAREAKAKFVQLISHELRTPLNAASTWLSVIEVDQRPETLARGLGVIRESLRSQARLVTDLVELESTASPEFRLHLAPMDLSEVAQMAVEEARPSLLINGIGVDFDIGPGPHIISGDRVRILQVVRNLIDNVVKYAPRSGRMRISVSSDRHHVTLVLTDRGPGLTPDEQDHVFDASWRGQQDVSGMGLGLALVRSLVDKHRGSVVAHSAGKGRGTSFTVRLPRLHVSVREVASTTG